VQTVCTLLRWRFLPFGGAAHDRISTEHYRY